MESTRVIAFRVCGVATCVVLLVTCLTFWSGSFAAGSLPTIHTAGGAALLVALTAFIVANVSSAATAKSVCAVSAAVIAVGVVLRIYSALASSSEFSFVDVLLSIAMFALLVPLYRSVWNRAADVSPA